MSKFKFIFLIFCLILKSNLISAEDNTLKVHLDRTDYVLNEKVIVHLETTDFLNETVEIIPKYETHQLFMNCTDCEGKKLGPDVKKVELTWTTQSPGSVIVYFEVRSVKNEKNEINLNVKNAYFQIAIGRSNVIYMISLICGWCYFLAWITSMYPQVIINFRSKSVVGLNFDYVAFSLIGYSAYAIYNSLFYYSNAFKNVYFEQNPHSSIPVQLNDVFFSIHGVILTTITVIQCVIYERGDQKISHRGQCLLYLFLSPCAVLTLYLFKGSIPKLDYLYFFSYVKIILTIGKYIPQAIFNYKRKSTEGWSIENCLLDLVGGVLSILQMLFLAINYNDIKYFTRNYAKLFVGLISCTFDIIFIVQHFFLYRHSRQTDSEKGSNASLRLDNEQFENSSIKQSLSLDRINTVSSLSKVLYEKRKSFVHCICGKNFTLYGTMKVDDRRPLN